MNSETPWTTLNVWREGREETVTRVTPVIRRVIDSQERRARENPRAIIRSQEVLSNAKGGGGGMSWVLSCYIPPSLDHHHYITNYLWRLKMRERNPDVLAPSSSKFRTIWGGTRDVFRRKYVRFIWNLVIKAVFIRLKLNVVILLTILFRKMKCYVAFDQTFDRYP